MYVPDMYDMWEMHDMQREMELARCPKCDMCDSIMDEFYYEIDGRMICKECLDDMYQREVVID